MATIRTKYYFTSNTKADITNTKIGAMYSTCSCHECDSVMCFAKRYGINTCSCNQCKNCKTCLFYTNYKADSKDSSNSKISLASHKSSIKSDNLCKGPVNVDLKRDQNNKDNSSILSKTNIGLHLGDSKDKCTNYSKFNEYKNISTSNIQNVPIVCSRKEFDSPTAKLSAQIMDLSYNDFKESFSYGKSDKSSCKIVKQFNYDIFDRIKEVYKACSCKVCECIVGKSVINSNDVCQCKPCDCQGCTKYMLNQDVDVNTVVISGCPCIRCTNSKCKGIVKKDDDSIPCDCKPCDCIQCSESFSKPCDCKPCQCIECKSFSMKKRNTLIIAPVGEDYNQRDACQCQPCDCIHCGQGYATSSLMREMSTGLNRHQNCHCETCLDESCLPDSNDTCKCERRSNFMRKPVQRDTHEFDIRHAIITNEISTKNAEVKDGAIATYTALTNNFPKLAMKNKNLCNCDECECLVCSCEEKALNAIKSSQIFATAKVLSNIFKTCNCLHCDCQYCASKRENRKVNSEKNIEKNCKCDNCSCLNCESLNRTIKDGYSKVNETFKNIKKFISMTECNICIKENSVRDINEHSKSQNFDEKFSDIIYPVKKGKLLTPDMFHSNINIFQNETCKQFNKINLSNSSVNKHCPIKTISEKKVSICHVSPHHSQYLSNIDYITMKQLPLNAEKRTICYNNDLLMESYNTSNQNKSLESINSKYKDTGIDIVTKDLHYDGYLPDSNFARISSVNFLSKNVQQKYNFKSEPTFCSSTEIKYAHDCKQLENNNDLDMDKEVKMNYNRYTEIGGECYSGEKYQYKDQAEKHIYVTNIFSKQDTEFEKLKQSVSSSKQPNIFEAHASMIKSKTLSKESLYSSTVKEHKKTGSRETILEKKQMFKDVVIVNGDIRLLSGLKRNKMDRRFNTILNNLSDSVIPCKFYNHLDSISNILKKDQGLSRKWTNLSIHKLKKGEQHFFQLDVNCERIRETLQKAKTFSIYLTNLLEQYEKANAEFVSISEKLKTFNSFLSPDINLPFGKLSVTSNDATEAIIKPKDYINTLETSSKDRKNIKYGGVNKDEVTNINIENCTQYNKLNPNNENRQSVCKGEYNLNNIKTDRIINADSFDRFEDTKLTDKFLDKDQKICSTCSMKQKESRGTSTNIKTNDIAIKESYRMYRKLIKRAIIISNKFNAPSELKVLKKSFSKNTSCSSLLLKKESYEKTYIVNINDLEAKTLELNEQKIHSKKYKMRKLHRENKEIETSAITLNQQSSFSLEQIRALNGKMQPPVYKNHCDSIKSTSTENKQTDFMETVSKDDLQMNTKSNIIPYKNKALTKLQVEIRKLLDLPILQMTKSSNTQNDLEHDMKELLELSIVYPATKKRSKDFNNIDHDVTTNSEIRNIASIKSSCENQRVSFLGARRVSDHTVLVKWNKPPVLVNVQGYELLVDGRAVQRLINPSKCMAVITCLPHADRVLLTIRTIMSTVKQSGHVPTSSIVYRPRSRLP